MDVLDPICQNCNGHGNDGAGIDPLCKGHGRVPISEDADIDTWVRWIREQPDVKHGVEVLRRMGKLHTAPAGLIEDDE